MKKTVIPQREHTPKRLYEFDGGEVVCFELGARAGSIVDMKFEKGLELFRLTLPAGVAEMLYEDLYYGEYTGS